MKDLYILYQGEPTYKRILLRKVTWWKCHWRNMRFYLWPMKLNLQVFIIGVYVYNGQVTFRLFNRELEFGW